MPHTEAQLEALRTHSAMLACPKCRTRSFRTIESHVERNSVRRRRYCCDKCSYRETRFELSSDLYDEYRKLKKDFEVLSKFFVNITHEAPEDLKKSVEDIPCYRCEYFEVHGCAFDLPEAGSYEADGCNNFSAKKS